MDIIDVSLINNEHLGSHENRFSCLCLEADLREDSSVVKAIILAN